ncbi:MAG: YqhA family protein [Thermoanaerobaculaceae bacterium]|jgi:uncharacterized membrane protein YqhA|nr:YqhA family protein [Thermoanaerobaculaceae bacterium]
MNELPPSRAERLFESALWNGRFVIILAVIGSAAMALAALVVASVDSVHIVMRAVVYPGHGLDQAAREASRSEILSEIIKALDIYLVAAMMGIFALGLYELFISKINPAEGSELAERMLLIRSLDDLKHRLAGLVVLILVTTFFQVALKLEYKKPIDLLFLGVGIALLAAAALVSRRNVAAPGRQ